MKGDAVEYKERPSYWDEWKYVEYLTLDQAAAMLSGIDPSSDNNFSSNAKKPMLEALKQAVLMTSLKPFRLYEWEGEGYDAFLKPVTDTLLLVEAAQQSTVLIPDLAAWADSKGIPHHWPRVQSDGATGSDAELKAAKSEIEALKARAETAENKLAELEASPFSARERNNMLRIVRALSEMARLPEKGAVPSVESQLQELGFTSPKEETIRKVLKEAGELEPDKNPN